MPAIRIPTPLRKLTDNQEVVQAEGATVGELLTALDGRFPGLRERICDEAGAVRRFVNVFVNDEDIRFLEDQATPVGPTDEVSIVPAIAGG
ncbi:MAG: MoaD/ThiS family protein [Verrucomicrobia bacterium]|nr:MoaD/ThiS family protein [Verrucomicrobiota bacterium]